MKNISTTLITITTLATVLFTHNALAGVREERQARSHKIEYLHCIVRDNRIERSRRIQAQLDLARLQAEIRKERRVAKQQHGRYTTGTQRYYY